MKAATLLIATLAVSTGLHADLNSLGSYVWNETDAPKVFNAKLQLSFVSGSEGFPSYGSMLAGGGYSTSQDGGAFQLYFPYSSQHGGTVPKIRLGLYDNQGWSDWETFYTSANANSALIDWSTHNLNAKGNVIFNVDAGNSNQISFLEEGDSVESFYIKADMSGTGDSNYLKFGSQVSGVTAMVIRRDTGNIGIGTTTPLHKLEVNGTIRTKEVIVETGWSDFVFEGGYHLRSLREVESHIEEHGHLPDVPSAATVEAEGLSVGEAQKIMMQKIEELTLYMIEKDKQVAALQARVAELESK